MSDTLFRLERVIAARRAAPASGSYVAALHARGLPHIAQKLGEEATETVIASLTAEDPREIAGEAADLLFHLLVLLGARDVPFAAVLAELDRRDGVSGLAEKASRAAPATTAAAAPAAAATVIVPPVVEDEGADEDDELTLTDAAPLLALGREPARRPRIRKG